ncbi:uncharacterized protein BKCO1_800026 [Diplodia corticola]|uniref:Uncharacterized protein n=1 Tax=Diplodia corticola TaxID=236234 RepID=A0A1J9R645_9PEZI|nr:uncharacterized protein BKCO1_800026 [Diplodia corticola]OJD36990.1 hypothetical protein BKCO1_800026 [Diplodia corticola]
MDGQLRMLPWVFLSEGVGGLIAKAAISGIESDRLNTNEFTVGMILLDVPNTCAFDADLERLSAALDHFTADNAAFAQLTKVENDFLDRARSLVLFSCFSYNAALERRQSVLNVANEAQISVDIHSFGHYRPGGASMAELHKIIQRATTLCTMQQTTKSRTGNQTAALDKKSAQLLEDFFPLNWDFCICSHAVVFSSPNNQPLIETHVRSKKKLLKDFCRITEEADTPIDSNEGSQTVCLRWYHAPANNEAWAEGIVNRFLSTNHSLISKAEFADFWAHNQPLAEGACLGSWRINPACASFGSDSSRSEDSFPGDKGVVLVVMPFLHWESVDHLARQDEALDMFRSDRIPPRLREDYEKAASDPNTRYTSSSVVSEKTMVTLFPRKSLESGLVEVAQMADLESAMLGELSRINHPSHVLANVYDFCALMLHITTTTLLSRLKHPDFLFTHFYRKAIGELRQKHVASLTSFKDRDLQGITDVWKDVEEENYELSLVLEANALKDELHVIGHIFDMQAGVVSKFAEIKATSDTGDTHLKDTASKLEAFRVEFQGLWKDTDAIERDLLHLLDLKQKRANLREAHSASIQAHEASQQTRHVLELAESSAWQSRIVMVFTTLSAIYVGMLRSALDRVRADFPASAVIRLLVLRYEHA